MSAQSQSLLRFGFLIIPICPNLQAHDLPSLKNEMEGFLFL